MKMSGVEKVMLGGIFVGVLMMAFGVFLLFSVFDSLDADAAEPVLSGEASWYSSEACQWNPEPSCPTASGRSLYELEKQKINFVAMWEVPFGTSVKVCRTGSERCVTAIVYDRGPARRLKSRVVDLSKLVFAQLGNPREGLIPVTVEILK